VSGDAQAFAEARGNDMAALTVYGAELEFFASIKEYAAIKDDKGVIVGYFTPASLREKEIAETSPSAPSPPKE
jgi:hypothetical protein